ncbi:hypothetical protein NEOLEDRAFT_1171426 [Neolentinus lepideus HHB14362 ss-1]|uniref:CoA-dependent acyltransferase n=1 Tax=Neolentinus lepideus HHB14362 ss-1 TaxID=1314782 RepID=A0A165QD71_9AGAM|nr:hypothetical protein NEOLEDRAFT_1171426 [Neolentinus lepideus HHB14362 ss-1]
MVQLGASASTSQVEPRWTWEDSIEAYSRPLLGSELVKERMHVFSDGAPEPCHGFTFQTSYDPEDIISRLQFSLAHLRFTAPLVAASIQDHHDEPGKRVWIYRSPSSEEDVQQWTQDTLVVHNTECSDEDFIASTNQTRLPFEDGRFTKLFQCHLLIRESGVHSLFLHGSHALLDPNGTIAIFREIFDYMSRRPSTTPLAWGEEWRALPAGPITSAGGIQSGADVEVPLLLKEVESLVTRNKMPEALHAQRTEIRQQGMPVRVHSVIPEAKFSTLKDRLKQLDLTVTVLLEAAFILTTFATNARHGSLSDDAYALMDMTMVPLNSLFISPHNSPTRVGSSVSYIPLFIDFKDILKDSTSLAALISVMHNLQAQYRRWTSSPHFPFLSYQLMMPANPNPSALVLADVGVIEESIPTLWPRNARMPTIELLDMSLGHRLAAFTRPIAHAWSLNKELHVQIAASDNWDRSVLANLLHESMDLALLITQDIPLVPKPTVTAASSCAVEHATATANDSRENLARGMMSTWGRRMARFLGLQRVA